LAGSVADVRVNDRPWQRFDRDRVWLPMPPGEYRVRARLGSAATPRPTRSTADFSECRWDQSRSRLHLAIQYPPWCRKLPKWYRFTCLVEHEGWSLTETEGAERLRGHNRRSIVRLCDDEVTLGFAANVERTTNA